MVGFKQGNEWKTVAQTGYGIFEYKVMAFGLAKAPAAFNKFITHVVHKCLDLLCIAHLDNIVIYSDMRNEHTAHVGQVLEGLNASELHLKLSKC